MRYVNVQLVLEALAELSSEEFQRKAWLSASGPQISSFKEAFCQLFDDTGLANELERPNRRTIFTVTIDADLLQLEKTLQSIDQSLPPLEILAHPQLELARALSKRILKSIQKESPNE